MGQPIPQHQLGQLDTHLGADNAAPHPLHSVRRMARKVPAITAYFWMAKLLTTALGESTSDYLVFHFINQYAAVILGGIGLALALALQLVMRRYIAWVYWLACLMVAIFGTMAADVLNIVILEPRVGSLTRAYLVSTIFFAVCLVVIFTVWYLVEKTLSIHSIDTLRRELFYWAAVMTTFALGTAAGDMTAMTLKLGYFTSGLLFIALFELPALGYFLFKLNPIVAFWFAYIITRPLGASFADWFGKPQSLRGLNFGDGPVSLVLFILLAILIGYLSISRKDIESHATSAAPATARP
jgi:uncharacterized membrane-anchored protein